MSRAKHPEHKSPGSMRHTAMFRVNIDTAATPYALRKMYFQERLLFTCGTHDTNNATVPKTGFYRYLSVLFITCRISQPGSGKAFAAQAAGITYATRITLAICLVTGNRHGVIHTQLRT